MACATAVPPVTASEPPSVKSFWTSTMISARRGMVTSLGSGHRIRLHERRDGRLPARELATRRRQLRHGRRVPRPGRLERLGADDLAVLDQLHEQRAVVAVVDRLVPDADHLGLRDAGGPAPAPRPLATADTDLVRALLRDADELAARALPRDELVDQTRGGGTAAGHQRGADAVGVDRRGRERSDRVLVEIAGHRDPGTDGAEPVQLGAYRVGLLEQVAGVDPDGAERRAG